ncbi:aminotransferase class V-fold PLP-dependent enzyme [Lachnospiraceae bacterium ZAX-1]
MIYFDNAATTMQKPTAVAQAVYQAILTGGNASRGAHEASLNSMRIIYSTREQIANLFGLNNPERVAFTANATESLNTAIAGSFSPGDHVITTAIEHNSVLRPLYRLEEQGITLTIIKADELGNISYDEIEQAIRHNTAGIVCTHASNVTGNVVDISKIGLICKSHNLRFIVDAAQTAGMIPINMAKMHIDILCFTGHKSMLGPQGTGGICVSEGAFIPPLKVGGSGISSYSKTHPLNMPAALEAGTQNSHGIAGLHAGLSYILKQGQKVLLQKEQTLMNQFYHAVKAIPNIKLYGDFTKEVRAPIVSLNIGDYDSSQVADELMTRFQIAVRAGAHCAPLMHKSLKTDTQGAVRFSFSHFNTDREIESGIKALYLLATEDTQ